MVCNLIYYIILVFFIEVLVHVQIQIKNQLRYLENEIEQDKQRRELSEIQKERKKQEKELEKLKKKNEKEMKELQKLHEQLRRKMNGEKEEVQQEQEEEEEEEKEEEEKKEEFLKHTDPIFISSFVKFVVLLTSYNICIVYILLLVNIIPTSFKYYFSIYCIYSAIVNIISNACYILYLKINKTTNDDMRNITFYNVSTMVIFYLTLFSISFITLLLAIQDMFNKSIRLLNSTCLLLYSIFFILYAYLCYLIYLEYLNSKKKETGDVYSDPSIYSTFKNLHGYLTYSMILNFFIYGIIVLSNAFSFVNFTKISAIVGILSGSLTLLCTLRYMFFVLTEKKVNKMMSAYTVTKFFKNLLFIVKCFVLGFVTIYHCYSS